MGNTHCHGNDHSRIRVETTVRRGKRCIQDVEKSGTELGWSLCSARQGIRSLPAKHVWKNRQNRRMVLVILRRVPNGHGRPKTSDQNGDTRCSSGGNGYVRDKKTTGCTQAKEKTEASYMIETIYNLLLKPLMTPTLRLLRPYYLQATIQDQIRFTKS